MIRMEQPSLVLHSHDVPGYKYKMDYTVHMESTATVTTIVGSILAHVSRTPNNVLRNVVINCHGSSGSLYVGTASYINPQNLGIMKLLRSGGGSKVETIWIVACQVAGKRKSLASQILGAHFCSEFAKAAGCFVVAADKLQYVNPGLHLRLCPKNAIDNYEGRVFRWDAQGEVEDFNPKKRI